ncbi:MAG: hypothetical protein RMJ07_00740 [Nitrososphaerota archaeon]|nr:hypothetical protein [Candidatus Bathyarchaeota archaeon]MDW8048199.1 hypothetical protein [Nitrososphaerota archaeon]
MQSHELVVLLLRDVLFKHPEFTSLEDYLARRCGFQKIEEKERKISELKELFPYRHEKIVIEEEGGASVVLGEVEKKVSSLKIYEGTFLESDIEVYMLGETTRKEVIVGVGEKEKYTVHMAEYRMIKIISRSGYAIQQLLEQLLVDIGIEIKSKEWVFQRLSES